MDKKLIAQEMMFLAFCASTPVGMGILHYDPNGDGEKKGMIYSLLRESAETGWEIRGGYIEGRMVKLHIRGEYLDQEIWLDQAQRNDYQSWAVQYPTNRALYMAALEKLEKEQDGQGN